MASDGFEISEIGLLHMTVTDVLTVIAYGFREVSWSREGLKSYLENILVFSYNHVTLITASKRRMRYHWHTPVQLYKIDSAIYTIGTAKICEFIPDISISSITFQIDQ